MLYIWIFIIGKNLVIYKYIKMYVLKILKNFYIFCRKLLRQTIATNPEFKDISVELIILDCSRKPLVLRIAKRHFNSYPLFNPNFSNLSCIPDRKLRRELQRKSTTMIRPGELLSRRTHSASNSSFDFRYFQKIQDYPNSVVVLHFFRIYAKTRILSNKTRYNAEEIMINRRVTLRNF